MMGGGSRALIRDLDLIGGSGSVAGLTDAELVGRFAGRRDGAAEVAFGALVARHGPTVLATCRRTLGDPSDADDAFQATFLVLARKAGSVRVGDSLAPWLRGVARRVAGRSLARSRRQRRFEVPAAGAEPSAEADLDSADLGSALFEELDRLPEKYRSPVVLCHLEGKTHEEAARDLKWPVGTVSGRLSRARDLLRSRLARRGLSPSAPAMVAALAAREARSIPPALLEATARLAIRFAAGGAVPESIYQLTIGVLIAMYANQIKLGVIAASAVALLTVGAGYVAGQIGGVTPPARKPEEKKAEAPAPPPPTATIDVGPQEIAGFPKTHARQLRMMAEKDPWAHRLKVSTSHTPSMVAVPSPDGRTIRAMSLAGGRWQEYRIPDGLQFYTIATHDLLALGVSGPDVREVAVFNARSGGAWHRQVLREPVSDEVVPVFEPDVALYQVGHDFYAYGAASGKWGVLHLTGSETPKYEFTCLGPSGPLQPASENRPNAIFVQQGRTLYVFSMALGTWSEGIPIKEIGDPK